MNNILILDTETTGIDINKHEVIEVAAILYSVKHKTVLQQVSTLIKADKNEAEPINKISCLAACEPKDSYKAISLIDTMAACSDAIVAHNADFDKQWMATIELGNLLKKVWICSYQDIEWPHIQGAANLINLALETGVPVVSAHRALTDCTLLANIFSKIENLEELLEESMKPKDIYIANVSFEEKELAKAHGFIWNNLICRQWAKKMSKQKIANLPFRVSKAGI